MGLCWFSVIWKKRLVRPPVTDEASLKIAGPSRTRPVGPNSLESFSELPAWLLVPPLLNRLRYEISQYPAIDVVEVFYVQTSLSRLACTKIRHQFFVLYGHAQVEHEARFARREAG